MAFKLRPICAILKACIDILFCFVKPFRAKLRQSHEPGDTNPQGVVSEPIRVVIENVTVCAIGKPTAAELRRDVIGQLWFELLFTYNL